MKFCTLSNTSEKDMLYLRSADAIRTFICDNSLKPGDKLPGERVLSEQLKISRNSVREGLRLLQMQKIVEVRTGVGTFVGSGAENEGLVFQTISNNFAELLKIKAILERNVIYSIGQAAIPAHLRKIKEMADEMQGYVSQGIYPSKLDREFHRYLLKCQKNRLLEELTNEITEVLDSFWRQVSQNAAELNVTMPLHVEIADCLLNGDVQGALAAYDRIVDADIEIMNQNGVT